MTAVQLIQAYWYLLFIGAAVCYYMLRPIADGVLKLVTAVLVILGAYGLLLFVFSKI